MPNKISHKHIFNIIMNQKTFLPEGMSRVEFSSHQQLSIQSHQLVDLRQSHHPQKPTFAFVCPPGTHCFDTAA